MKKLPAILLVLTLAASGAYIGIYLNRWEWNRALFVTMVFVAAEIALIGWLMVQRLKALEQRVEEQSHMGNDLNPEVLEQLRQSRPTSDRFEWLRESATRHNVFITMLVGAGIAVSALAWILDKIAETTITPTREAKLARELGTIAFPSEGLVSCESSAMVQDPAIAEDPEMRLLVGDTAGPR